MKPSVALALLLLLLGAAGAAGSPFKTDAFIRSMESLLGAPGTRKPIMQCQCSIEYLGTKAEGHGVYAVYFKKLD